MSDDGEIQLTSYSGSQGNTGVQETSLKVDQNGVHHDGNPMLSLSGVYNDTWTDDQRGTMHYPTDSSRPTFIIAEAYLEARDPGVATAAYIKIENGPYVNFAWIPAQVSGLHAEKNAIGFIVPPNTAFEFGFYNDPDGRNSFTDVWELPL
jgi:hypothetical protein